MPAAATTRPENSRNAISPAPHTRHTHVRGCRLAGPRLIRGPFPGAGYSTCVVRDAVAGLVAVFLILSALSLATALQTYRRRRQRARDSERALGRTIVAEIPAANDLILFSQDGVRFYYGDTSIDKDLIVAVRVLINGSPIAAYVSRRRASEEQRHPTRFA